MPDRCTPEEMAEFKAWVEAKRQERERQNKALSTLVKQRRAEAGNGAAILHFYGSGSQSVALVQIFTDGSGRITRYTDIGPMGHCGFKDTSKLGEELRMEGFNPVEDPNAGVLLEEWSHREKWAQGLKSMELIAIGNSLRYHGHYNLACVVERTRSTKMGYYYCRQFGVEVL